MINLFFSRWQNAKYHFTETCKVLIPAQEVAAYLTQSFPPQQKEVVFKQFGTYIFTLQNIHIDYNGTYLLITVYWLLEGINCAGIVPLKSCDKKTYLAYYKPLIEYLNLKDAATFR